MPRKTCTEEFKRDAVALYENSPGTSIHTIATDLGVNRATLANWVKKIWHRSSHGNTLASLRERS